MLVYHAKHLERLVAWAKEPIGTPIPQAVGVWDNVFAALSRRTRLAYDQRERLAAALNRFREASQAMPDGVVYLSDHHLIEWMNIAATQHFGLDAERDVGSALTNLVRQPDFVRYMESDSRNGEPFILSSTRSDGLTLSIQLVPFGEKQTMLLSRDITQLHRLETMRRDFVANVSHELKTPLTVVSGFIETLLDGDDFPPEDRQHFLRLALEQAGRMQNLVEDLLTLSNLETSSEQTIMESVDAASLARNVQLEAIALSGSRHTIELLPGPALTLLGCHKELHSAFANLASNAVRYTPEGGRITLSWALDARGASLSVADTGIGIDTQHLPRLTERFYRVDRGRSRESGGTGLGLAIVKHILTRHQAQLEIESEPGQGSRFTLRFPASRIRLAAEQDAPTQALGSS